MFMQQYPLLQTKLHIPPIRPELVSRPRLIERLNEGLPTRGGFPRTGEAFSRALTLISAPAGFGKTTLVSEWVNHLRLDAANENQSAYSIAWLSLDEGDNDPARFLAYIVAALRTIEANIGKGALSALQSPQPPPAEAVLISLINEIAAIPGSIILVLDDHHTIESSPVDNALAFLLERLPPQMHLIIATREDPYLPLARLRARGQLTEVRAADLRFTSSEVAEFLNQAMGLDLSAEDIAVLETRTEGWIAGLQLAALSMQRHKHATSLIQSFTGSHRFVLDYLIEEVLEQQTESVQTFLLQTAVLERLTGSLCDAVCFGDAEAPSTSLGTADSGQAILETLDRANLFIIPLDEERRWYRYHRLFADLLRQRLRQTQPDWVPSLHLRASEWYEENGFTDEAIEHALHRKDFERAADKIEEYVDHVLHFGEHSILRRWLDEIPVEVTFSKPHLCILHAGSLYIGGQIDEAERYLQAAEQVLDLGTSAESDTVPTKTPDRLKYRGRAAVVRSFLLSYKGDVEGSIQFARQALEYLPKSDSTWRCSAFDSIGTAYSSVDDVSAYHARAEALEASQATGNVYMNLFASLRLVVSLRDLGRLQQAIELCQQQLELAKESGYSQTALIGWLYTLWGEILAERNELDSALQLTNKGVELTERGKDKILLGSSYMCLMRVLFSRGDFDIAQKLIQEVDTSGLKQNLSPWILNQMAAWQARIWVAQGKLDSASHWAQECDLDIDGELTPLHDFDYVVLARVLVAQGRLDETSRLLQRLLEAAEAGGRTSKSIEILVLQALAFQASGESTRAMTALERALTLAEPGGFVRIFVDEGPPVAQLLYTAAACGTMPDYTAKLLAVFETTRQGTGDDADADIWRRTMGRELSTLSVVRRPSSPAPSRAEGLVEPLSERELEVLQLVAEGLTNREIACRLFLSLNTVKAHCRNIYGKLNVHSRTQAIARAQELELLPRS
jgi:LuxR family maltose regulon positive regulatory protein